jgi:hypothetical protein
MPRAAPAIKVRGMPYALYFSNMAAPLKLSREALDQLVAVHFSTEEDALHAAALVLRGGQYVWLIEGPGARLTAPEIEEKCQPILRSFKR